MNELITANSLTDLTSESTPIDFNIRKQKYDSNCTCITNWFAHAGTHCSLSRPEPVNAFESIAGLVNTMVDEINLPVQFREQSDVPSL